MSADGNRGECVELVRTAASELSAVERLKQTNQFFEQGLISKDDYDKKMKAIMDPL